MLSRLREKIAHGVQSRLHRHIVDAAYDREHKVETGGRHWPAELGLTGRHARYAHEYLPSPTLVFKRMVNALSVDLRDFAFIDLGSGKGRILVMAAELPFRRVEGVELSSDLHRIALKNIGPQVSAGSNIIARNMDAAEYEFPPEPFVVYLFNPFGPEVIARVLENLGRSFQRNRREGCVLYLNAKHRDLFDSSEFLTPLPRSALTRSIDRVISPWPIALYRTRQERLPC